LKLLHLIFEELTVVVVYGDFFSGRLHQFWDASKIRIEGASLAVFLNGKFRE